MPVFGFATRLPPPPQEFGKGSLLRLDLRRRGLVMARRQKFSSAKDGNADPRLLAWREERKSFAEIAAALNAENVPIRTLGGI